MKIRLPFVKRSEYDLLRLLLQSAQIQLAREAANGQALYQQLTDARKRADDIVKELVDIDVFPDHKRLDDVVAVTVRCSRMASRLRSDRSSYMYSLVAAEIISKLKKEFGQ